MADDALTGQTPRPSAPASGLAEAIHRRFAPPGGVGNLVPHPSVRPGDPPPPDAGRAVPEVCDLRRTCIACPSQWEGRINDQGSIYIRYRWGRLTARVSMTDADAAAFGAEVYDDDLGQRTGDRLGGYMDTEEMREALAGICHFNGGCDEEYWRSHW